MAMEKHHKEDDHDKFALTTQKHHKGDDQQCMVLDPMAFEPFESLGALWQGPFSMFQNFCASGTRVDWKETADHHIFKADIPGKLSSSPIRPVSGEIFGQNRSIS